MITKVLKAEKLTVLKFIMDRGVIHPYDLVEFGYTDRSARVRLKRLKKEGPIINMTRGCWS